MKSPIETAGTLPKLDDVVLVFSEESVYFMENDCHVELIWMGFTVKDLLCSVNGIGNNYDFGYVIFAVCLVDTTSNSKKFCFSTHDVRCMMNCLCQRVAANMYIRYRCSNVFLDASICYHDGCVL